MSSGEHIQFPREAAGEATTGTAGLHTQLPGLAATVSAVAQATGSIRPGALMETARG